MVTCDSVREQRSFIVIHASGAWSSWCYVQVEAFLRPYVVLPVTRDTALLEVVPNARSKDQLRKVCEGNLYEVMVCARWVMACVGHDSLRYLAIASVSSTLENDASLALYFSFLSAWIRFTMSIVCPTTRPQQSQRSNDGASHSHSLIWHRWYVHSLMIVYGFVLQYFLQTFGQPHSAEFLHARSCFAQSLAGYSLVGFLLQVRCHSCICLVFSTQTCYRREIINSQPRAVELSHGAASCQHIMLEGYCCF
jgi:hypothetical protein